MAPAVADLKAMTDAFEGIDRLAEGAPRTDGAPNFRRVRYFQRVLPSITHQVSQYKYMWLQLPGFPLFGTGQTTIDGFEKCLEPVLKKYGDEKHIFWVNLRSVSGHFLVFQVYTAQVSVAASKLCPLFSRPRQIFGRVPNLLQHSTPN